MRMPPWEGAYSLRKQQRVFDGTTGDTGQGSSSNGHTDSASSAKRQRRLQRTEGMPEGSSASERHLLRPGTVQPGQRIAALPPGYTIGGPGDCFGRLAGMPPPQELDYETELSDGFAIGFSHYNSHVFATRCGGCNCSALE